MQAAHALSQNATANRTNGRAPASPHAAIAPKQPPIHLEAHDSFRAIGGVSPYADQTPATDEARSPTGEDAGVLLLGKGAVSFGLADTGGLRPEQRRRQTGLACSAFRRMRTCRRVTGARDPAATLRTSALAALLGHLLAAGGRVAVVHRGSEQSTACRALRGVACVYEVGARSRNGVCRADCCCRPRRVCVPGGRRCCGRYLCRGHRRSGGRADPSSPQSRIGAKKSGHVASSRLAQSRSPCNDRAHRREQDRCNYPQENAEKKRLMPRLPD